MREQLTQPIHPAWKKLLLEGDLRLDQLDTESDEMKVWPDDREVCAHAAATSCNLCV